MKKKALSTDVVEQSLWSQADQFLAKALLNAERLCEQIDLAQNKAAPGLGAPFAEIECDALLVRQSVAEAAALRGLSLFGKLGETCAFDPMLHELSQTAGVNSHAKSAKVKITIPGVISDLASEKRVLIRAKAKFVKSAQRAKAPKGK